MYAVKEGEWRTLRQFVDWWWRSNTPCDPPVDMLRQHRGSHETVLYRCGQFQVEQITLYPGHDVPSHSHPNVETVETHLVGSGLAYVGRKRLPYETDTRHHPRARRLVIQPGVRHRGVATTINVALSFQRWKDGTEPTFITDDWRGGAWPE